MKQHLNKTFLLSFFVAMNFLSFSQDTLFKPSIQVGGFLQMHGKFIQNRTSDNQDWQKQLTIYRGRFLLGGQISPKTTFFMQTELPTILGLTDTSGNKNIKVSQILLDAQIQQEIHKNISVIGGMQLVGITRNALQSPVTLMGLDFGYNQYQYSLFENQPLQNNFGRDIGVNLRGFALSDKFEYRVGVFRGGVLNANSPLRSVVRVNYNFWEKETFLYYTGTSLGEKKRLAIGGGLDLQNTYFSGAVDAFLDLPINDKGALTIQTAYSYLNGGNKQGQNFTTLIPTQHLIFIESGYYFKKIKLQPTFKYETSILNGTAMQYGITMPSVSQTLLEKINKDNQITRFAFGINYYYQSFDSHLKLQYEHISGGKNLKDGGEVTLQWTYFIFK